MGLQDLLNETNGFYKKISIGIISDFLAIEENAKVSNGPIAFEQ